MKNFDMSNAFPGPINGPPPDCVGHTASRKKNLPILDISVTGQSMRYYHHIWSVCVRLSPCFVCNRLQAQHQTRFRILTQWQSTDHSPVRQKDSLFAQHVLKVSPNAPNSWGSYSLGSRLPCWTTETWWEGRLTIADFLFPWTVK